MADWQVLTDDAVHMTSDVGAYPRVMQGATEEVSGKAGLVPAPAAGDHNKVLSGTGEWIDPPQSGTAGGMILPQGVCAAENMGSNVVTPAVSSLTAGMMILQTFTTPVPQYTGYRLFQVSTTPQPLAFRFRDQGEPELPAGTYLLRRESNGYLVVVGRMQEQGQGGITPHIGDNGNWFIGDTDTGSPSRGEKGDIGTSVQQTLLYENADGLDKTYTEITVAAPTEYDYFVVVTDKGTFPIYYSEKLYGYITGGTFSSIGGGAFYVLSVCFHAQGATWTPYELAYFSVLNMGAPAWANSSTKMKVYKIIGVKTVAALPTWNGGAY